MRLCRTIAAVFLSAAALLAPLAPRAQAARTPLPELPAPAAEAGIWLVEFLLPLGETPDGRPLWLAELVEPETHTRALCIVQPPLGLYSWEDFKTDVSAPFSPVFWRAFGSEAYGTGERIVVGVKEAGLTAHDIATFAAYKASGAQSAGVEFRHSRSQIFKAIEEDPNQFGTPQELFWQILDGGAEEIINIGTLGFYKMIEGYHEGVTQGDWRAAQSRSLQAVLLTSHYASMERKGIHPGKVYSRKGLAEIQRAAAVKATTASQSQSSPAQNTRAVSSGAENVNAQAALRSKLSALNKAQQNAVRVRNLPDGRIRYYAPETPARTPGPTRGASYVTEYNPQTGQVRSWVESYNQAGNVVRVHPKMINGQTVNAPHYPPTGAEVAQ